MRRLTNIRKLGRYRNTNSNEVYNIWVGRRVGRSIDQMYQLYQGRRIWISDAEVYGEMRTHEKIN